jgi:hypothetical protein
MSAPGYLQDVSYSVEHMPCLLSLADEGDMVQTEESKLIDDSECHSQGLGQSSLAAMMSLDNSPTSSYHEDLSSLLISQDEISSTPIRYPNSFPTKSQNLTADQLVGSQSKPTSLDLDTTSISTTEYVDSPTSFHLSRSFSKSQKRLTTKDRPPACSSLSSLHTHVVRNREVQTLEAAPAVSSEAITYLSEHRMSNPATTINSTKTAISPITNPNSREIASPSLTASLADIKPVTTGLCSVEPSICHSMDQNNVPYTQTASVTLATRTTEDVIADLSRVVHPARRPQNAQSSGSPHLTDVVHSPISLGVKSSHGNENASHESDRDEDDGDGDDEVRPPTRTKKISERKRRMNALADQYILGLAEKATHKDDEIKPEDEALQSTKWLVNQSENREIISSAREYQTELFERAKVKNIIAVLDTGLSQDNDFLTKANFVGTGKTLIAVLLLRHVFAKELEDRELGKPKRISFFLVRLSMPFICSCV